MPLDRYGRPGLLGAIDPAYIIAGGPPLITMVSRGSDRQQENLNMSAAYQTVEQAVAEAETEAAAAERAAQRYATFEQQPDPASASDDLVGRLDELARLRDRGALSQSEYETAKTRLLSS
jgi:hypothetical protein